MLVKVLAIVGLIILAWMPISLGIQALHRKQNNRPWAALGILAVALVSNVVAIIAVGPRILFVLLNLG